MVVTLPLLPMAKQNCPKLGMTIFTHTERGIRNKILHDDKKKETNPNKIENKVFGFQCFTFRSFPYALSSLYLEKQTQFKTTRSYTKRFNKWKPNKGNPHNINLPSLLSNCLWMDSMLRNYTFNCNYIVHIYF
jgi:hypothetical protein